MFPRKMKQGGAELYLVRVPYNLEFMDFFDLEFSSNYSVIKFDCG